MKYINAVKFFIFILIANLAGFIGSYFTISSIPTWYATLNKPFFNPPNWIFGPVWTILYTFMGISSFLVYKRKGLNNTLLKIYFIHLGVNSLWSIVFFGLKNLSLALLIIIILLGMIVYLIKSFRKISVSASNLLIPYFFWVSFATILNLSIIILN